MHRVCLSSCVTALQTEAGKNRLRWILPKQMALDATMHTVFFFGFVGKSINVWTKEQ